VTSSGYDEDLFHTLAMYGDGSWQYVWQR